MDAGPDLARPSLSDMSSEQRTGTASPKYSCVSTCVMVDAV
ncbi:hypothetical protein [Amycolatopsis sp. NPDC001319]